MPTGDIRRDSWQCASNGAVLGGNTDTLKGGFVSETQPPSPTQGRGVRANQPAFTDCPLLSLHIHHFRQQLVHYGHDARVRLKAALGDNHIGELAP